MKNLLFLTLACVLLAVAACKRDCTDPTNKDCVNYDPCYGYQKPTAAFRMYEEQKGYIGPTYLETSGRRYDSAMIGGIRFKAVDTTAVSYKWIIGNNQDTLYGVDVELYFPINPYEYVVNTNLHITLIATWKAGGCLDQPYTDTLTRDLYFYSLQQMLALGTWRGNYTHLKGEVRDIRLWYEKPEIPAYNGGWSRLRYTGFLGNSQTKVDSIGDIYIANRYQFHFSPYWFSGDLPVIRIQVDSTGTHIRAVHAGPFCPNDSCVFVGTRIP